MLPLVFSSKCCIHLQMLEAPTCLHAVGQGALAVECRSHTLECVLGAVLGVMMIEMMIEMMIVMMKYLIYRSEDRETLRLLAPLHHR